MDVRYDRLILSMDDAELEQFCRSWVEKKSERSHLRIVSGAPFFTLFFSAISTPGLKLQLCLI
jgi:hypothetical protein